MDIQKKEEELEFYKFLKNLKKLGDRSILTYWKYYNHIDPNNITEKSVKDFLIQRNNVYAVRGFMKAYLQFRGLHKQIDLPPAPRGRKPVRVINPLTPEEISLMKEYLYKEKFAHGLMFDIMTQGALRRFECPTIRVNSFFWKEWINDPTKLCKLRIAGKGNKERVVLINPDTCQRILERLEKRNPHADSDFIFNMDALLLKNFSEFQIWRVIRRASKKVLQRYVRPHEVRHYMASELQKRGVDIMDIKEYLGHASINTTQIYLHRSSKESLENIEKKLSNGK